MEQNRKHGSGRQRNDRLFLAPVQAAHGDAPRDVFAFPERLRAELEDFFVWSTRWEKKDLRFLGWGGIDEAEVLLSTAERAARGGPPLKGRRDAQRTARRGRRLDDAAEVTWSSAGWASARCDSPARASGATRPDRAKAHAVLRRAVELGVNLIDTADSYGPEVSERDHRRGAPPLPGRAGHRHEGGLDP